MKSRGESHSLGILGATGRTGSLVRELAEGGSEWTEIVPVHVGTEVPRLLQCDVIIDFSTPEALKSLLRVWNHSNACLVSGTTGLSLETYEELRRLSAHTPVLHSTNFSLGIYALRMALKGISKHVLSGFFPPTIEEHHHQHKRDSPSGTALTLAQELKEHFSIEPPVISSRREGDIVGFHEILWKSEFETLRLSHEATDRRVFASGALSCASQIVHRRESFRKLRHILTLDEIFAPTTDFVD